MLKSMGNKTKTLFLIKSTKDYIFGAYTEVGNWEFAKEKRLNSTLNHENKLLKYMSDPKAFIFSLVNSKNKSEKFPIKSVKIRNPFLTEKEKYFDPDYQLKCSDYAIAYHKHTVYNLYGKNVTVIDSLLFGLGYTVAEYGNACYYDIGDLEIGDDSNINTHSHLHVGNDKVGMYDCPRLIGGNPRYCSMDINGRAMSHGSELVGDSFVSEYQTKEIEIYQKI